MAEASRDQNRVTTLLATSNVDGVTPVVLYADPVTHRLLVNLPNMGTVTSIATGTGLTGGPITTTGTIALATNLQPMATLGTPLQYLRVNAGGTALEYATLSAGGTVTSVSSANADIGVANPTTTPVLTLNSSTAISSNTIVKRDANGNIFVNNYFEGSTSTVAAGGTTILTVASTRIQTLTGSLGQTFQLPDATTLTISSIFVFNNNSSSSLTITNNGGITLYVIPAGGGVQCVTTNVSTANGNWDFHTYAPSSVTWSSGVTGLVFNSALTTTPSINTGISSAANPSFIPQRGSATTGYGGDSTHLYGSIGGAAAFTATATTFTGAGTVSGTQLISTIATGTAPLSVTSTTPVPNLSIGGNAATVTNATLTTALTIDTGTVKIHGNAANTSELTLGAGAITINGTNAQTYTLPSSTDTIVGRASTDTLTNKRITKRVLALSANSATPAINTDSYDVVHITSQSTAITSFTTSLTGTPVDGDTLRISITGTTAIAITWGTSFEASTVALPTTTTGTTRLDIGFFWNSETSKWRCVAVA